MPRNLKSTVVHNPFPPKRLVTKTEPFKPQTAPVKDFSKDLDKAKPIAQISDAESSKQPPLLNVVKKAGTNLKRKSSLSTEKLAILPEKRKCINNSGEEGASSFQGKRNIILIKSEKGASSLQVNRNAIPNFKERNYKQEILDSKLLLEASKKQRLVNNKNRALERKKETEIPVMGLKPIIPPVKKKEIKNADVFSKYVADFRKFSALETTIGRKKPIQPDFKIVEKPKNLPIKKPFINLAAERKILPSGLNWPAPIDRSFTSEKPGNIFEKMNTFKLDNLGFKQDKVPGRNAFKQGKVAMVPNREIQRKFFEKHGPGLTPTERELRIVEEEAYLKSKDSGSTKKSAQLPARKTKKKMFPKESTFEKKDSSITIETVSSKPVAEFNKKQVESAKKVIKPENRAVELLETAMDPSAQAVYSKKKVEKAAMIPQAVSFPKKAEITATGEQAVFSPDEVEENAIPSVFSPEKMEENTTTELHRDDSAMEKLEKIFVDESFADNIFLEPGERTENVKSCSESETKSILPTIEIKMEPMDFEKYNLGKALPETQVEVKTEIFEDIPNKETDETGSIAPPETQIEVKSEIFEDLPTKETDEIDPLNSTEPFNLEETPKVPALIIKLPRIKPKPAKFSRGQLVMLHKGELWWPGLVHECLSTKIGTYFVRFLGEAENTEADEALIADFVEYCRKQNFSVKIKKAYRRIMLTAIRIAIRTAMPRCELEGLGEADIFNLTKTSLFRKAGKVILDEKIFIEEIHQNPFPHLKKGKKPRRKRVNLDVLDYVCTPCHDFFATENELIIHMRLDLDSHREKPWIDADCLGSEELGTDNETFIIDEQSFVKRRTVKSLKSQNSPIIEKSPEHQVRKRDAPTPHASKRKRQRRNYDETCEDPEEIWEDPEDFPNE